MAEHPNTGAVAAAIPFGRENAISRAALAQKLDMSDRKMREAVEDARLDGLIIINTQNGGEPISFEAWLSGDNQPIPTDSGSYPTTSTAATTTTTTTASASTAAARAITIEAATEGLHGEKDCDEPPTPPDVLSRPTRRSSRHRPSSYHYFREVTVRAIKIFCRRRSSRPPFLASMWILTN